MIERHYDYVYNVGTIAAGATVGPIQLQTETDAPFDWRSVGGYYWDPSDEVATILPPFLRFRFADPDRNWLQNLPTPGLLDQQQPALFRPLRRHITYPAQGVVQFVLVNDYPSELANVTLIFRGCKLYPGTRHTAPVYAPTYPECYTQRDFQYETLLSLAAGAQILNTPLTINDDADYAWRGTNIDNTAGVVGVSNNPLELRFRDVNLKAFANNWIRAQWLCGTQAARPALWYPELYIERGKQFCFDARNVSTMGAVVDCQIALNGAKVFRRG